jgi:hypothetical protein
VNSHCYQDIYKALFGGRGFGKNSMSIGPRQLEQMPVPSIATLKPQSELSNLGKLLSKNCTPERLQQLDSVVESLFNLEKTT